MLANQKQELVIRNFQWNCMKKKKKTTQTGF